MARPNLRHYGFAVFTTTAAVLVKEALGAEIVPGVYMTLYASVLLCAVYGGVGPALLATGLGAIAGAYLYLPLAVDGEVVVMTIARVALFIAVSAGITWIVSLQRRERVRVAESEARLRRMFESDMVGIILWDLEGGVLDANDRFLAMVGYSRDDLRQGRVNWRGLTPGKYAALDDDAVRQVRSTGAARPFEKEYVRKDGSRIAVMIGPAATSEARDRGVSFVLDISERKRAEDALREANEELERRVAERTRDLRESEERYRQISELTSDYAYRLRIEDDGRVVFEWSAGAFERITGFDPKEVHGVPAVWALVHPEDRPVLVDRTARLLRGEAVTTDFRIGTKTGEYRWLRDVGRAELDEGGQRVVRIVGAARDITERKLAQQALRESEERFALAAAGANDGIWDWDLLSDRVYLSPRWHALVGITDPQRNETREGWIARVHPDDAERVSADVFAHLEGRVPFFRSEYRLRHEDGSYLWVLSRGLAVRGADGVPYRMAGSLTDVTPRRKAEAEARRRQSELAHAQRLSTIGEMAAGLAHELNQPLSAIVSFARGCERRIREGDVGSRELLHVIDQIARQALRAGGILKGYRVFGRPAGERRACLDVNALTREIADFAMPVEEQLAIRLELAPQLPAVRGDALQIEQVLVNLIRNGIDAMQDSSERELCVQTIAREDEIEVAVTDVGRGIPEEARERVFDTFFTTKPNGLGMGLSISRSIIEAHGGRLWATPGNGRGTTFHFTLPIREVGDSVRDTEPSGGAL